MRIPNILEKHARYEETKRASEINTLVSSLLTSTPQNVSSSHLPHNLRRITPRHARERRTRPIHRLGLRSRALIDSRRCRKTRRHRLDRHNPLLDLYNISLPLPPYLPLHPRNRFLQITRCVRSVWTGRRNAGQRDSRRDRWTETRRLWFIRRCEGGQGDGRRCTSTAWAFPCCRQRHWTFLLLRLLRLRSFGELPDGSAGWGRGDGAYVGADEHGAGYWFGYDCSFGTGWCGSLAVD
ncbi:hypothetical protein K491DRAFT_203175 [Lophiostoma macrostomum CBS 122681]|uniref:Uncharacterized protein n=1 Tax=Lophiostoma macrostomum CBS 122681 TaxID=1314788 RepID=A0A6A6TH41_9PLEO|nr:hypothetical protein K491DRAFT_203175 [Lophiostoma macrostomum CBS 122681]